MDNIKLNLNEKHRGAFTIAEGEDQLGEMEVAVSGKNLIVYHTEVAPKAEGKGIAKKLLAAMVAHAREQDLKVVPLCAFVHAQFKRHADEYVDVWNKEYSEDVE
ncbi:MAG: GNAT family N-acetyltransferase [Chitinophagaceae bacterium]